MCMVMGAKDACVVRMWFFFRRDIEMCSRNARLRDCPRLRAEGRTRVQKLEGIVLRGEERFVDGIPLALLPEVLHSELLLGYPEGREEYLERLPRGYPHCTVPSASRQCCAYLNKAVLAHAHLLLRKVRC